MDQLSVLSTNYVCDKSQLLEIICISFTEHNNTLPNLSTDMVSSALKMLEHQMISPDVAHLLVGLVKNLIINTVDDGAEIERKRALKENLGDSSEDLDNQADHEMVD